MSSDEQDARRLLSLLRDPLLPVDEGRVEERRQRIVPAVLFEVALAREERARRQRRRSWGLAAAMAAAAGLLLFFGMRGRAPLKGAQLVAHGVVLDSGGDLVLSTASGARSLDKGATLDEPGLLDSRSERAEVQTSAGVRVSLAAGTRLGLSGPSGEQLSLQAGRASFHVPPQAKGHQFMLRAPFGAVVVHGTVFSVDLARVEPCVRVQEGQVEVQHSGGRVSLAAGAHWGCADLPAPAAVAAESKEIAKVQGAAPARRAPAVRPAANAPPAAESTLSQETALVEAALSAQRRGEHALACGKLTEVARRYPQSPLLPAARAAIGRPAASGSVAPRTCP